MKPEDLRAWRMDRELSQIDLATLLGVTNQTVYRWEAGTRGVPAFLELALRYLESQPLLYREPALTDPS